MDKKIFFHSEIGYIHIDLNQIFKMKPSELKISISIESYDEKTAENYRNSYVAEGCIVSKLFMYSFEYLYQLLDIDYKF